jgi:predicted exporter
MMAAPTPSAQRWLRLLLWATLMALCALLFLRTPIKADLSAFLPASVDARQQVLIEQIKHGAPSRTLFIGIDGADAASRARASQSLQVALSQSGLFDQVSNGDFRHWESIGKWLLENRYRLSPAVQAQRFTEQGLTEAIMETTGLLGAPGTAGLRELFPRDPTGEMANLAQSLLPTQAPKLEDGVWVSRQHPRALLMATTRTDGADMEGQARAVSLVEQGFARIQAEVHPGLQLKMTGAPVFSVQSRTLIESEIHWLGAAGSVLVAALVVLALASLRALMAAVLPVMTGLCVGVAAVCWLEGSIHGITLAFGATLIGESVDYALYYLIQSAPHARALSPGAEPGWRHWLARGWPTVRLGLLTSICGFAALAFSGFEGLRQLGVFSMAGLTAAALTTRWILPLFLPNGAPTTSARLRLAPLLRRLFLWAPRLKGWIWGLALVSLALVWHRGSALWESDLRSLSPVPGQQLALDQSLRSELMASDSGALVVVRAPSLEGVLEQTEAIHPRLDAWVERGRLGGYQSAAMWLPSQASQAQRLSALPETQVLRAHVASAARDSGLFKAQALEPFVQDVQAARSAAPLDLARLGNDQVRSLLHSMLVQAEDGAWVSLMPLSPAGEAPIQVEALQAELQDQPGVHVLAVGDELSAMYAKYLGEARKQASWGAVGVLVLIALSLRSLRRWSAVALPLALTVVITLGLLAAGGPRLGILHLVGLLLVVAIGSNYALFFEQWRHEQAADDHALFSLLLANLTTVGAFGLIACSSLPALSHMGWVVAPGALLSLLISAACLGMPAQRAQRPGV